MIEWRRYSVSTWCLWGSKGQNEVIQWPHRAAGLSSDVRVCEHIHSSINYLWLSINSYVKKTLLTCQVTFYAGIGGWWQNLSGPSISNCTNFYIMLEIFSSISACWSWSRLDSWHGSILIWSTFWQNIWNIQYFELYKFLIFVHAFLYLMDFYHYLKLMKILYITVTHNFSYQLNFNTWLISVTNYWDKSTHHQLLFHIFQTSIQTSIHKWSCVTK